MGWRLNERETNNRAVMYLINRGLIYTVIDSDTRTPIRSFHTRQRAARFARPKKQSVISTYELIKT